MKQLERTWMVVTIVLSVACVFLIYFGFKLSEAAYIMFMFAHIFLGIIALLVYSTLTSRRARRLEETLPQKGEECYCYVYSSKRGDNDSIIFNVVVHLEKENTNKLFKYHTFVNRKIKCNNVLKGYYYNNDVVLVGKSIDIKDLPQNIIDAFELSE